MTKRQAFGIIKSSKKSQEEEKEMLKEEMMDKVIAVRGFEDGLTIWFCGLCEWQTAERLIPIFNRIMETPIYE